MEFADASACRFGPGGRRCRHRPRVTTALMQPTPPAATSPTSRGWPASRPRRSTACCTAAPNVRPATAQRVLQGGGRAAVSARGRSVALAAAAADGARVPAARRAPTATCACWATAIGCAADSLAPVQRALPRRTFVDSFDPPGWRGAAAPRRAGAGRRLHGARAPAGARRGATRWPTRGVHVVTLISDLAAVAPRRLRRHRQPRRRAHRGAADRPVLGAARAARSR